MSVQVSPLPSVKEEDTCCDWSALRLSQCVVRSQHAIRSHTSLSPGELKANTLLAVETKEEKTKQNPEIKLNLSRDSMSHTVLPLWTPQDTYLGVLWLKCTDFLWTLFLFEYNLLFWMRLKSHMHSFLKILSLHLGTFCSDTATAKTEHRITLNVWEDLCFCHMS